MDLDRIRGLAERVSDSNGVELVDVEFRGGGKARMLRLFIDKPGGVTHEDCANVSRELSTLLDVEDAVPGGSYTLEVSSPGLDRKLSRPADFERFVGSRVKVHTREAIEGERHFDGRLEQFSDNRLKLDLSVARKRKKAAGPDTVEIDLGNVEKANLVPEI